MNRCNVLLIVTSPDKNKPDRFIEGEEWEDVWKFEEDSNFAYLIEEEGTDNDIKNTNDYKTLPELSPEQKILVWLNTKAINNGNLEKEINNVIDYFNSNNGRLCIAYHGIDLLNQDGLETIDKKYVENYTLQNIQEKRFYPILKIKDGKKMLDSKKGFDVILGCFFRYIPNQLIRLYAEIRSDFSPLCQDLYTLQTLKNEKKKEDFAKELLLEYGLNNSESSSENERHPILKRLANLQFLFFRKNEIKIDRESILSNSYLDNIFLEEDRIDKICSKSFRLEKVVSIATVLDISSKVSIPKSYRDFSEKMFDPEMETILDDLPGIYSTIDFLKKLDHVNNHKELRDLEKGNDPFEFQEWVKDLNNFLESIVRVAQIIEELTFTNQSSK